ncbi:Gfo/Idh/MocA family oxidoreductase [Nocardia sp. NPDC050710]|uniref:Gfo/Idh/MocA family protein n=1 Tax=Nocardia sp. NPDC050710 TaxID=3157220 RepID=UPI0033D76943
MSSLEVGIVGYGLAGAVFHAPLIAAEPRMRVAAVVTRSAERAAQARREHPGMRVVPDAATGKLGAVRRFESRFERWRPVPKGGWREVGAAEEGAGLLYDLGSHLVDQALTLFGPVRSVYCELDRRRDGIQTDDDVFLALTHTGGVRSHLWASAVAPRPGPRFRVLGSTAGYVTYGLDPQEDTLRAGRRPCDSSWGAVESDRWGLLGAEPDLTPHPTLSGDYPAFYAAMAAAILDGAPVPVDPHDAVTTTRLLEAARRSAADARIVNT